MSVLVITYDLYEEPGRSYEDLSEAIQVYPWCCPTESTWYVQTELTPEEFYERLTPHLHQHDKVLISRVISGEWWSRGMSQAVLKWLHGKLSPIESASA